MRVPMDPFMFTSPSPALLVALILLASAIVDRVPWSSPERTLGSLMFTSLPPDLLDSRLYEVITIIDWVPLRSSEGT